MKNKRKNVRQDDDRSQPGDDHYNSLTETFSVEDAESQARRECGERVVQGGSRRRDAEETED